MKTSMYQSLLSDDGLREILSGNLQEISTKTQVPESTLRRYRNGSSDLDSMPLRTLRLLTEYSSNKFDFFDVPNNYFLNGDIFHRVLECVRTKYNQLEELYNSQIYFNWQNYLFLNNMKSAPKPRYFFIDDLKTVLETKPYGVDLNLLFSVGLAHGLRFIFNLDNVPVDFDVLHSNATTVVTGNSLKLITQVRLDEMKLMLDQYDGVIIEDVIMGTKSLYEDNVRLMVIRDMELISEDDKSSVWTTTLKQFVYDQDASKLLGFIMSTSDEQVIFARNWLMSLPELSALGITDSIINSLVAIIITFFTAKEYDKSLVRYL